MTYLALKIDDQHVPFRLPDLVEVEAYMTIAMESDPTVAAAGLCASTIVQDDHKDAVAFIEALTKHPALCRQVAMYLIELASGAVGCVWNEDELLASAGEMDMAFRPPNEDDVETYHGGTERSTVQREVDLLRSCAKGDGDIEKLLKNYPASVGVVAGALLTQAGATVELTSSLS